MKTNKLIISSAGSGKTTHLVQEALKVVVGNVLITTYTIANEQEIRKKIIELNEFIPENITIQTWFSFLLQHCVRPYQKGMYQNRVNGLVLVNEQSAVRFKTKQGVPVCWKEEETEKHYFTKEAKIYSDKLSKFAIRCNELSKDAVFDRIEQIYTHIFVDEVQDLAGYDLEIVKKLFDCKADMLLVGDPRQVTYLTHHEAKYKKYRNGLIKDFICNECKKSNCIIDEKTLNVSYRNNEQICSFSSKLFTEYGVSHSKQTEKTGHDGVFLIRQKDVEKYLEKFEPTQLCYNKQTDTIENYETMNFGISKGLTRDRVLIYPTKDFLKWIKNNDTKLEASSRSKLYVAITRAKYSVGIIYDFDDKTDIGGVNKWLVFP